MHHQKGVRKFEVEATRLLTTNTSGRGEIVWIINRILDLHKFARSRLSGIYLYIVVQTDETR